MRLLNTTSFELVWCIDNIPDYAILSHTWGDEEVTFKDLDSQRGREKKGWSKITNACRYAASYGWEYIWIDTCCIDKSDPTELGEAINSMFSWYESASVCYAYLADVSTLGCTFERSRWFTRGWTLQELLAPNQLEFLDSDWKPLGSREDWVTEIEHATGIKHRHLADFRRCCLATKLSWAANRQTTRTEDHAYSLLGLLGVHIPLIYGEGENAFVRLQQELLRNYNDESILAWHDETFGAPSWPPVISGQYFRNTLQDNHAAILARSPRNFRSVSALETQRFDKARLRFEMTNCGLRINAHLFENRELCFRGSLYLIELNCTLLRPSCGTRSPMVLVLRRDPDTRGFAKMGHPLLDRKSVDCMPGTWRDAGRHDILILEGTKSFSYYTPDDSAPKYIQYQSLDIEDQQIYRHVNPHIASRSISSLSWSLHAIGALDEINWPFPLRKNQAFICDMIDSTNYHKYLVIVKWGARAVTCGIWLGSFDVSDILNKLDSDKYHPFPTRSRSSSPRGSAELRALVLAEAHKGPGKCYNIAFRRFPLRPLEENEPSNGHPATLAATNQSTMPVILTNQINQALSSSPEFRSTHNAQRPIDGRLVGSWFDQLLLRNSDMSCVTRMNGTNTVSGLEAADGDSQGATLRNYPETNYDDGFRPHWDKVSICDPFSESYTPRTPKYPTNTPFSPTATDM